MAAEALIQLAPGFSKDRDEDWMIYLAADKQAFMREKRGEYIGINEKWDNYDLMFQTNLKSDTQTDPATKQRQIKDHQEKYEKFLKKRDKRASKIIDTVRQYKEEGRHLQDLAIQREAEEIRKRRRLNEDADLASIDSIDSMEVDVAYDEYMPSSYLSREGASKNNRKGQAVSKTPPPRAEPVSSSSEDKKKRAADKAFLEGASDNEVTILLELKPLINSNSDIKEQTRNRVLKTIRRHESKKSLLKALEIFTRAIEPKKTKKSL